MNKEKQIRKRTWKYFFEQKVAEIGKFIGWVVLISVGLFLIFLIMYLLGKWACTGYCTEVVDYVVVGLGALFIIFVASLMLWLFFYEILYKEWLVPNWERATERAEKDFKGKKK